MLSINLMLCFTRDVFSKYISLIANMLAYSTLSSHASFCSSKYQSHNPVRSFFAKVLPDPYLSLAEQWSHLYMNCPLLALVPTEIE